MPGSAVNLGPFVGGLNTLADPSSIEDNELAECINFDIEVDGSLINRSPFTEWHITSVRRLLGYYISPAGTEYLVGENGNNTVYWNGSSWTYICGFPATAIVQYQDKLWLVSPPGHTVNGGSWDGTTFTSVAAIPKGSGAAVYKERLWVTPGTPSQANGSRLRFSKPGDFTTWDAADFIDINSGDGQNLVDLIPYQGNLVLLKSDSTYVLSFETDPARGAVNLLSADVGVSEKDCVVSYENNVYVLHEGRVFELANYSYTQLNYRVPFVIEYVDGGEFIFPVSLSKVGDRLLVRYYKRLYVYNLKLGVWTRWDSNHYPGKWVEQPVHPLNPVPRYYAAYANSIIKSIVYMNETPGSETEPMECYVRSKIYDFDTAHVFKRLFWWGIDIISNGLVTAEMTPVVYNADVRWIDLEPFTWEQLEGNTWAQPMLPNLTVETIVSTTRVGLRKFIKLLRSTRFRQIFFEATMNTDGSASNPVRLFKFVAVVGSKATVTKQIS